jgi:hypothetical protein
MKDEVHRVAASLLLTCTLVSSVVANSFSILMVSADKKLLTEGTEAQARQLWEQAITAKGGRERLRRITSLYVARIQPGNDRDYEFHVFPDYSFNYTYGGYREDTAITIFNHKRAVTWWLPPRGHQAQAMPLQRGGDDPSDNIIAQFLYLMVTNWLNPIPLRARKEWVGLKRVDVIEVDAKGWRVDYYLDPKTHLPFQVVSPYGEMSRAKGEMEQVVRLDNYALLDGVMMPRKASYSYAYRNARRKWTEQVSFEINPPYDSQFFEKPPTNRTLPESWRAKNESVKKP